MRYREMKMKFEQNMTVEQIEKVAENNHQMLWDMINYLNPEGKAAMHTYSVISWYCPFSESTDELAKFIREDIEQEMHVKAKDKEIIRNLNAFIKNYLENN